MITQQLLAQVYHRRLNHQGGRTCAGCECTAAAVLADVAELEREEAANLVTTQPTQPLTGLALEEVLARLGQHRDSQAPRCFP